MAAGAGLLLFSLFWGNTAWAVDTTLPFRLQEQAPPWAARSDAHPSKPLPPVNHAVQPSGIASWYRNRQNRIDYLSSQAGTLQEKAQQGDIEAQYELGLMYQGGRGVSQNDTRAMAWLQKAAEAGHDKAQYALALLLRKNEAGGDLPVSLRWQEQAAQKGNTEAQYGLGLMYANGQYVPQDQERARFWYGQAASRGHLAARLALGNMQLQAAPSRSNISPTHPVAPASYTQTEQPAWQSLDLAKDASETAGVSIKPAVEKLTAQAPDMSHLSAKQLRQAAFQGDVYAQFTLGIMYEDGTGELRRDLSQAATWYLKAARQGYPKAQHNLALLYEDGRGLPQSYKQAAIWYQKAADSGFSEAQNNLAVLYIMGSGVPENKFKAEQLLRAAVQQGNENAQRNLQMLLDGMG